MSSASGGSHTRPTRPARGSMRAAFEAYPDSAALLNASGTVVATNAMWKQFGRQGRAGRECGPGANYLQVCDRSALLGIPTAELAATRLRDLMAGQTASVVLDYSCQMPEELRWYQFEAVRYSADSRRGAGEVLVRHLDITRWMVLSDALRRESETDPLTGLANRRGLLRSFERVVGMSGPEDLLVVMMVDIDHFKHINDDYGHLVGDECLQLVSQWLVDLSDEDDVISRWGGDEFVIIGHGGGQEQLHELMRKVGIRAATIESRGLTLDLSWGIACGTAADPLPSLLSRADRELAVAKRSRDFR